MNQMSSGPIITHEQLIGAVRDGVKPFYSSLDAWHDIQHGSRVAALAVEVNVLERGDLLLVEAGAWLHQFHDNLDDLWELLQSITFSDTQRDRLFEIVEQCRPAKISSRSSHEAQIVFDADALELMGPSGIVREVLCNVVARGKSLEEAVSSAKEVQDLFVSKLQTNGGRQLAQPAIEAASVFWNEFDRWEELFK